MAKQKARELFNDNLKDTNWLGEVVNNEDPLFEGRCRVKVFGKFDDIPDDDIPWARCQYRATAGSATGSGFHSVPKVGSIVCINFDNGNVYEPEYYCINHVSDELKSEIEGSYENAHALIYDTETEGSLKVFFTEETGWMMDYKETHINIKPDNSIFITNPNGDVIEMLNDGNIKMTHSADVNIECVNATITASSKAHINAPLIDLGESAAEAVVKGDTMRDIFNAHIHPTPAGPSGPPTAPIDPSLSTVNFTD
tara:strand:- start:2005 stop:2766 length:762 start_codon:yes stop_codon:yes gene_type:complete